MLKPEIQSQLEKLGWIVENIGADPERELLWGTVITAPSGDMAEEYHQFKFGGDGSNVLDIMWIITHGVRAPKTAEEFEELVNEFHVKYPYGYTG